MRGWLMIAIAAAILVLGYLDYQPELCGPALTNRGECP